MQSSPRAARDARIPDPATAELGGQAVQAPARRWYSGLARLFGQKTPPQKAGDANNALLAFPSEAISRSEPAPVADIAKRQTPKVAKAATAPILSPKLQRAMLIVGAVALLAGLGAFAIQRASLFQAAPKEPPPGNLTINTRPADAEVLTDGTGRGSTRRALALTPGTHRVTV